MLPAETLDWLRGISAAFLPDAAAISRYTETNGPDGVAQSWTTIASGLPCRVSPIGAAAVERPGEGASVVRNVSEWRICCEWDADITELDRVTITGSDRPDGRTFEVNRVGERSYCAALELICTLVT